jgi:hypothetical protein
MIHLVVSTILGAHILLDSVEHRRTRGVCHSSTVGCSSQTSATASPSRLVPSTTISLSLSSLTPPPPLLLSPWLLVTVSLSVSLIRGQSCSPPLTLPPRRVQRSWIMSCTSSFASRTKTSRSPPPHPHKLKKFLVCFDYLEQHDATIRADSLTVGATIFLIHPWHLESYTRPANWFYHVRICVECFLLHAWSAEGIRQVLMDVCVFDHMEASTFC